MKLESLPACAGIVLLGLAIRVAAADQQGTDLARAKHIQQEVAEIRGLPFRKPVPMERQTPEELGRRMDAEDKRPPGPAEKNFDRIARRLGLYRGPVIEDFRGMMRGVMTSQAAAYYNSATGRIYILSDGEGDIEQGIVYSHELYHALQDQYFNLAKYQSRRNRLDSDQQMARVAVVEGEATYIHTIWGLQQAARRSPARAEVGAAIRRQVELETAQMQEMASESGKDSATAGIPPFIAEILIGNYLKGASFIFAVHQQGWPAVEKLYKEYPPRSTEQILHPEKWLAREDPQTFKWSGLRRERALKGWELIDDDVLGEIQWRIIFREQGLADEAVAAAAGWNGDRYAVFKRKNSDETLLLLRTSWDSEAEATQFADAYRRLLPNKYGNAEPVRVEQQGADVFIVEGGQESDLDQLLTVVKAARKTRG